MARLNKDEFYEIRGRNRICNAADNHEAVENFWTYFDEIPVVDHQDCNFGIRSIKSTTKAGDGIHDLYYLACTDDPDTSMVLVVDRGANRVRSHCFLDLKKEMWEHSREG